MDVKPRDMYVRRAREWEALNHTSVSKWQLRVSDVEFAPHGILTGMLLDVTATCRLALTLQLPVVLLACGPLRNHEFSKSFVGLARRFLLGAQDGERGRLGQTLENGWPMATDGGWSSMAKTQCGCSAGGDAPQTSGGLMGSVERRIVWKSSMERTESIIELQGLKTTLYAIMDGIMAKGGTCPDEYLLKHATFKQARNPSTLEGAL